MREKITIGSRGSKLALIQTESVLAKIREANPDVEVVIRIITTKGDRDRHVSLDHMASIGVFVKELEDALLGGQIDIAVHSLKDMPTYAPPGLCLAAVTERLDPRDVLISRGQSLAILASGSRIGTGSLRRAVQLNAWRSDLEACSIRGNVDTRLRKVANGDFAGVIVAAAAMKRLGWGDKISEYLPLERFLPAVGQGALAIEVRSDDEEIVKTIIRLNHLPTWQSVNAERAFLRSLGGGCRAPIAALGIVSCNTLKLQGMVADAEGKKILINSEEGSANMPEETGEKLAERLFARGAAELITEETSR
jgi:hydroxymethylbilane synthase